MRARGATAWACALALLGGLACRVPREVHEPREYPPTKLGVSALELHVSDPRPSPTDPALRPLLLPADFEGAARERLLRLVAGQGPALEVKVSVAALDELELLDARGEMTRVLARLELELRVKDDVVIRRAETQSTADLPRDEATPEEVQLVLRATVIDAFDRYFADARVLEAINRDLAARSGR